MSYGSWLGGIWILQLDENTGLRDYTVDYGVNGDGTANKEKDYYFGKKLAGGNFVSGEASYVEYIDGYYYLFVTYGGLTADGGYQMRIFRSSNPDGPYKDYKDKEAIFRNNMTNFGLLARTTEVRTSSEPTETGVTLPWATSESVPKGTTLY